MVSAASERRCRVQQPVREEASPRAASAPPRPAVPTRVSRSRCRYPLRRFVRSGLAGAVLGTAHAVGLRRQQRVDERVEQLAHQIRARLGQLLVQEPLRVDTGVAVIVVSFFESVVRDHSKDHAVTAPASSGHGHRLVVHHSAGLNWWSVQTRRSIETACGSVEATDKQPQTTAISRESLSRIPLHHSAVRTSHHCRLRCRRVRCRRVRCRRFDGGSRGRAQSTLCQICPVALTGSLPSELCRRMCAPPIARALHGCPPCASPDARHQRRQDLPRCAQSQAGSTVFTMTQFFSPLGRS